MAADTARLTRAGCLIVITGIALPFVVFAVTPGPWWLRAALFLAAFAMVAGGLPWLAQHHLVVPDRRTVVTITPGADTGTARPGPDDPVHYIDFDDRTVGCTRIDAHPPHLWFWKADLDNGNGTSGVALGHKPCGGIE